MASGQRLDALFIELSLRTGGVATEIQKIQRELARTAEAATGVQTPLGSLGSTLPDIAERAKGAEVGLRRIGDQALKLAADSVGLKGPLENIATELLAFGPQGAVIGAAVAGLTLLITKLLEVQKAEDELRKKRRTDTESFRQGILSSGPLFEETQAVTERRAEIRRLEQEIADLRKQETFFRSPEDAARGRVTVRQPVRDERIAAERQLAAAREDLAQAERLKNEALAAADEARAKEAEDAKDKAEREREQASRDREAVQRERAAALKIVADTENEVARAVAGLTDDLAGAANQALTEFNQRLSAQRETIARTNPELLGAFDKAFSDLAKQKELEFVRAISAANVVDFTNQIAQVRTDQTADDQIEELQRIAELIQGLLDDIGATDPTDPSRLALEERLVEVRERQRKIADEAAIAEGERSRAVALTEASEAEITEDGEKYLADLEKREKLEKKIDDGAKKSSQDRLRDAQALANVIQSSVNGALQLANAFGLVNDQLSQQLQVIGQIAAQIPVLATAISTGNIEGIVSSGLGILGGIGSLVGSDPERERVTRENTQAIERLTKRIGDLGGPLGAVPGSQLGGVTSALEAAIARALFLPRGASNFLNDELARLGLTFEDLATVAEAVGVTFVNSTRPTLEELNALLQAIQASEAARFAQTFEGQLDRLQARFDLFDVTQPLDQLAQLLDLIRGLGAAGSPLLTGALAGADISSAGGRAALEATLQSLFARIENGTITAAETGGLSPQEFLQILRDLESLLDQANESEGSSQSFAINRSITEVTGSRIASALSTQIVLLQQLNETALRQLAVLDPRSLGLAALASPLQPPSAASFGGSGTTVINESPIVIEAGAVVINFEARDSTLRPEELARFLGNEVVDQLASRIAERIEARRRARGESRIF